MGTFQFRTQDGRVFEFQAPDAETATRAFQATFPAPDQPAAPPAQQPAAAPAPTPVTSPMDALDVLDRRAVADVTGTMPTPEEMPAFRKYDPADFLRTPEDTPERGRAAVFGGLAKTPGNIAGAPADILDMGYGGIARVLDMLIPGDQSARYADPQAWRSNIPLLGQLPGSQRVNEALAPIVDPLIQAVSGGEGPLLEEEMTPGQRMASTAAEFAGSTIVPSTILANPATRQAAKALPDFMKPSAEALTRPYLPGPRQATPLGDAIAAAGAGTTYQAWQDSDAREAVADLPAVGEPAAVLLDLIAGLVGGVGAHEVHAAIPAAGRQVVNTAKAATRGFSPEVDVAHQNPDGSYVKARDLDLAARMVQGDRDPLRAEPFETARGGIASDPAKAAETLRANVDALRPQVGADALPTTGLASNDIGLIGQEQALRQDPRMRNAFIQRDRNVRQAAVDTVEGVAPAGAEGRAFTDAIEGEQQRRVASARRDVDAAEEGLRRHDEDLAEIGSSVAARRGTKPQASGNLAEPVIAAIRGAQQRKNAAFDAIDPEGTKMRPADPLLMEIERINRDTVNPADRLGGFEQGIRDIAERNGGVISFRQLNELRTQLSRAAMSARNGANPNYTLADNLDALRRVIDDEARIMEAAGDHSAAYAGHLYRAEFQPTYNRGGGDPTTQLRRDLNRDRQFESYARASEVADRYLQRGSPERLQSLRRVLDDSPDRTRGMRAVGEWLAADLAGAGGVLRRDGTVDPAAVRRWIADWGDEAVDMSPGFRRELEQLVTRAEQGQADRGALATRLRETQRQLAEVEAARNAIGRVLGNDPVHAVGQLLNSGDPKRAFEEIANTIRGNEVARAGLKAAVVDHLVERATTSAVEGTARGSNPLSFARLDEIFKRHEDALAGSVFSPEEMHSLRVAHRLLSPLQNRGLTAVSGSTTSAQQQMYQSLRIPLKMALRLRFGLLKGGGVASVIDNAVSMLDWGKSGANGLIARMFFDPDLAAHLLTRDVSQVGSPGWNSKLIALLTAAAAGREMVRADSMHAAAGM